jgi:hypothetical protein
MQSPHACLLIRTFRACPFLDKYSYNIGVLLIGGKPQRCSFCLAYNCVYISTSSKQG